MFFFFNFFDGAQVVIIHKRNLGKFGDIQNMKVENS
jgi:hypothetical protein